MKLVGHRTVIVATYCTKTNLKEMSLEPLIYGMLSHIICLRPQPSIFSISPRWFCGCEDWAEHRPIDPCSFAQANISYPVILRQPAKKFSWNLVQNVNTYVMVTHIHLSLVRATKAIFCEEEQNMGRRPRNPVAT